MYYIFSWGCDHEDQAREQYCALTEKCHTNFKISPAGLFVDIDDPIVGVTPDGMVTCDCCGDGVLEVKCPCCYKNDLPVTDSV